jgi:hypothetical protein
VEAADRPLESSCRHRYHSLHSWTFITLRSVLAAVAVVEADSDPDLDPEHRLLRQTIVTTIIRLTTSSFLAVTSYSPN